MTTQHVIQTVPINMNEGVRMSARVDAQLQSYNASWASPSQWTIIFVTVYMNSSVISALLKSCHLCCNKYQFAIFQFVGIGHTTMIFNGELAV